MTSMELGVFWVTNSLVFIETHTVLTSFISVWHKLESLERRGNHSWENVSIDWGCRWNCRAISRWCGQGILGSTRKLAKQAMENKPVRKTPPMPLHQLLPIDSSPLWGLVLTTLDDEMLYGTMSEINPPFPMLFLAMMFYHSNSNPS